MKTSKRVHISALIIAVCLFLVTASGCGVAQSDYADAVAQRDRLQTEYDTLNERYNTLNTEHETLKSEHDALITSTTDLLKMYEEDKAAQMSKAEEERIAAEEAASETELFYSDLDNDRFYYYIANGEIIGFENGDIDLDAKYYAMIDGEKIYIDAAEYRRNVRDGSYVYGYYADAETTDHYLTSAEDPNFTRPYEPAPWEINPSEYDFSTYPPQLKHTNS
jgi:cell division protein FtsL